MTKKVLILGVTGQDGSFAAELLIKKKNVKYMDMLENLQQVI